MSRPSGVELSTTSKKFLGKQWSGERLNGPVCRVVLTLAPFD